MTVLPECTGAAEGVSVRHDDVVDRFALPEISGDQTAEAEDYIIRMRRQSE